jgi:hypothetical protein
MQTVLMLLLAAVRALALALAAAPATEPEFPIYRCHFTKIEPKLDGVIDDEWKEAAWSRDFVDVSTGEQAKMRTRVKMMWDEKNLYVAAEMEDHDVAATMTQRDAHLWEENAFEVFIDPDNDAMNYAEIQVNPLNALLDLTISKPYTVKGRANFGWNIEGLHSAVRVDGTINDASDTDRGWSAEMVIPLAALEKLGPAAKAGARWRMEMARVLGPEGNAGREHWTWAPTGEISFHMPEKWGWLEFIRE